jgi:hypothetical protein
MRQTAPQLPEGRITGASRTGASTTRRPCLPIMIERDWAAAIP